MTSKKHRFTCSALVILMLTVHGELANESAPTARYRTVFPFDFVRFMCIRSQTTREFEKESCTWRFFTNSTTNPVTDIVGDCFRTTKRNISRLATSELQDILEGYIEVPEKAYSFSCAENDVLTNMTIPILVQNVKLANPAYTHASSTPIIVLQRFSNDYGTRLGAHDVSNQEIVIDGEEVSSMKLLCISNTEVKWTNITDAKRKVIRELEERDKSWLMQKSKSSTEEWKIYLQFLLDSEKDFAERMNITRIDMEELIYTKPLNIRNITNETSRIYECHSLNGDSSRVSLRVENPQKVGPDEIAMIQQIAVILDSLAQGKGKGNEPWYSLASLLSIILILFMYYCRMKLQQGSQQQNPCTPKPPDEETEMRTRLQVPSQSLQDPEPGPSNTAVVNEQVQRRGEPV